MCSMCRGVMKPDDDDDPLMRGPMRLAGIGGPGDDGPDTPSIEPAPRTPPSKGRLLNSNGAFLI